MGKKDVLMIFDYLVPRPRGYDFKEEFKGEECTAYREVYESLKRSGHSVRLLAIHDDIKPLIEEVDGKKPDIVFNLADLFRNKTHMDKNIAGVLEMLDVVYTGATPENLFICNDKALSKKILTFHRIKVPNFHTFYRGHKVYRPKKLRLPLIVKPLGEEASRGISQASVADTDESFQERVRFIHENMNLDAIAEEYIEGREFYVSMLGNGRIKVFPLRELKFGQLSGEEPKIATYRAKWDPAYRDKWQIKNVFAGRLPEGWERSIANVCKRAYKALNMQSYARIDVRVTPEGEVYVIEANANPNLASDDEFQLSADKGGMPFDRLVEKIMELGFKKNTLQEGSA
jgi:D-alanine-D-alanine ligase